MDVIPMRALLLLAVLVCVPVLAGAQTVCASADHASGPLPLACADRAPRLDSTAVRRVVRVLERGTSATVIAGRFRLGFSIDTTGRARRDTIAVFDTVAGDAFAERFARRIVSELRYSPALRGGRPIRVWWEQELIYEHPGEDLDPSSPPLRLDVEQTTTTSGGRLAVRWKPVANAPLPDVPAGLGREHQVRALRAILRSMADDSLAYACVSLLRDGQRSEPSVEELRSLRADRARTVRRAECPPTYGGMIAQFDSLGRPRVAPPGAGPDPHHLRVTHVVAWTEDWVVVHVAAGKASSGHEDRCTLHRGASGEWEVSCRTFGRWIS